MTEQHHPVRRKKFNPTQATETVGVAVFVIMGIVMLVGLLTASGHLIGQ